LNAGIFFEFIPFTSDNFDEEGNPKADPETFLVNEVKEDVEYAVMADNMFRCVPLCNRRCDRFTNAPEHEIAIIAAQNNSLAFCGEHLSIDNMNKAVDKLSKKWE